MVTPEEILAFWLDEVGPDGWYKQDDALDQTIRERFLATWEGAMEGRYGLWLTYPSGVLAYIILLDQFPRNIYRGTAQAFASDGQALAGQQLAAMHRSQADNFGWHRDNTIGSTPQVNQQEHDWQRFWREHRLGFQLRLAARNGAGRSTIELGQRVQEALPALPGPGG